MGDVAPIEAGAVLRALLAYAKRGWHVFPLYEVLKSGICSCPDGSNCESSGKHPRTHNGFKSSTTDESQIRTWVKRWPNANWGIDCGASGLAVVDVDPRNRGDDSLVELESKHGTLPTTVTSLTGGHGQHYIYSGSVPSRAIALGIELKSKGGYIVVPPSNHVSGSLYRWDAGAHPNDTQVQPLPRWLSALAGNKSQTKEYQQGGSVTDGFLGAAFKEMGWLGRGLGPDKATVQCPWEDEHSCGKRHDSSTIVFAPRQGSRVGWFHCSHAHCGSRKLTEVIGEIPEDVKTKVRTLLALDPLYDPATEQVPEVQDMDQEWAKLLSFTDRGNLKRDPGNAALLLGNLDQWRGCLQYDEFADKITWTRPPPEMQGLASPLVGDELADSHVTYVGHWFARYRNTSFGKTAVQDALESAAKLNTVHPVRDYLNSITWDKTRRVATWLQHYLGAPDDEYIMAAGRWWLISAVARVMMPGCQADHVVVLEGAQGAGKSTAVRILGGKWTLGSLPTIRDKDAAQALQGHWIVEIGELDAFRGSAGTRVKDWVTQTVDSYRPSYGRFTVSRPRQCVFIGTTNEDAYLTDSTGARRFWPVLCNNLQRDELIRDRDQIWAEAAHLFHCGEPWYPSDEYRDALSEAQEARYEDDPWLVRVADWTTNVDEFTVEQILLNAINLEPGRQDRAAQTRVGVCLRRLGFTSRQVRRNGTRVRVYRTDWDQMP